MERIDLYYKKLEILTCHINKHIDNSLENKELLDTTPEKNKQNIKTFLAKTLPNKENFRKQSTKVLSSDYYIYEGLKRIWSNLCDDDKVVIWNLLFEMFMISIQIFPIVKQTDYTYISIYMLLEETKTDIPLPKLPVLTLVIVLFKEAVSHIKRDFDEGKISKAMIDHLVDELKHEDVTNLQPEYIKSKIKDLMEKKDIKNIIDIMKKYLTDYIIERIKNDCNNVFNSNTFKKFSQKYNKNTIISMIQKQEFTFVNIRQMVYDSGIIELLGDDFEIPTCWDDFVKLVKKHTGQEVKGNDLKDFFEKNLSSITEIPQFKKFINNSGYKHLLDPVLNMFKKTDYSDETLKRKLKRRKKKLRNIKNDASKSDNNKK